MNRQCWQEVWRQLGESRAAGLVAVLLLATATAWSGALWEAHRWVGQTLLNPFADASIAATMVSQEALTALVSDIADDFPAVSALPLPAAKVREELLEWFPDVAQTLEDLPVDLFPPMVTLSVPREHEQAVVRWLRNRPGVALVEHSHRWEARVQESFRSVWLVFALVGGALLAGCTVVVILAVRLLVQLHREEIVIMRLIGAYEADIRLPYLMSGLILGLVGGAAGAGVLSLGWLGLKTLVEGVPFPTATLVTLPLASAGVGLTGAVLGLMAVTDPDLTP